ncbi:MAG: hypothetical protein IKT00_07580 [Prevotella sp.]|nr:hypothetical protein [Prevotella sp.]
MPTYDTPPTAGGNSPVPNSKGKDEDSKHYYLDNIISFSQTLFTKEPQVAFCEKVKREITRYGVENALTRWRVVCDYLQTECWWPEVARKVELVFDDAFNDRNHQLWESEQLRANTNVFVQTGGNPTGVRRADQVIGLNKGDVTHTKYE